LSFGFLFPPQDPPGKEWCDPAKVAFILTRHFPPRNVSFLDVFFRAVSFVLRLPSALQAGYLFPEIDSCLYLEITLIPFSLLVSDFGSRPGSSRKPPMINFASSRYLDAPAPGPGLPGFSVFPLASILSFAFPLPGHFLISDCKGCFRCRCLFVFHRFFRTYPRFSPDLPEGNIFPLTLADGGTITPGLRLLPASLSFSDPAQGSSGLFYSRA